MNKRLQIKAKSIKIHFFYQFVLFVFMFSLSGMSVYANHLKRKDISAIEIMQQKKITLNIQNKSLKYILNEFSKLSGLSFMIEKNAEAANSENFSINVKDESLETALNTLLSKSSFTYKIVDNIITILKKESPKAEPTEVRKITITGVVVDEEKNPIAGATVLVQGTPTGAITDSKGAFMFIANSNAALEVSYTGKKNVVVDKVERGKALTIVLKDDAMAVDDVVVTGYQTVSRKDMVGSFTTIKADDIRIEGTTNILDMLQGQVAGMIVSNTSSRVGSSPTIKIRGTATLGNTDPIFVVDGIIQPDPIEFNASTGMTEDLKNIIGNQVAWLNPDDIETITVLKDASATAIYGSRASNGVIVITTKKPKQGDRLNISYRGGMTVKPRPTYSNFNFMNSRERIIFSEEAFAQGARYNNEPIPDYNTYEGIYYKYLSRTMSEEQFIKRKAELESINTDWFDVLTRTAITNNHNISLYGASDKATYRISLSYANDKGIEIGNSSNRITANANIGLKLHEKVRLNFVLNGSLDNIKGYGPGVNPIGYATTTSRAIPAYEEDGTPAFYNVDFTYKHNNQNPFLKYSMLNEMEHSSSGTSNGNTNASLTFAWDITKWLKYEFTGGASYITSERNSYAAEQSFYIAKGYRGYDYGTVDPTDPWYNAALIPRGGIKFTSNASSRSYNLQNKLIFQREFNENHRLNVMLAMEVRSTSSTDAQNTIYGFAHDKGNMIITPTVPKDFVSLGNSPGGDFLVLQELYAGRLRYSEFENNFMSFFMTAAYTFRNKYVLNANARNDSSNRFGQDTNKRFDPTYSFGLSWRVSEEPWMESVSKVVSNLNLKATYGIQGNANLAISPDLILIQNNIQNPFKDFGAQISSIPNPNLSWERTVSWNFGLDMRLLDRFNVVFDYYTRKSNAVIEHDIPQLNGIDKMKINGGILYNNGAEITVSFNPVSTKNFGVNLSVNSSRNWNKGGKTTYNTTYKSYINGLKTSILKEGYPISGFWSYDFAGLSPVDGKPTFRNMDVASDIAKADPTTVLVYSGSSEPDFTGGLNFSIRYKNLTLSSGLSLLLGGYKRLPDPYRGFWKGSKLPDANVNVSKDLNNRWKKPGDELHTNLPGIITGAVGMPIPFTDSATDYLELYNNSSERVVSSSFLRCRNLSLSYKINGQKIGFNTITIGGSVSNLFVIASKRYNGFDPELGDSVQPQGYSLSLSFGF